MQQDRKLWLNRNRKIFLAREEEKPIEEEDEEGPEYVEYTDSEGETGPSLKAVFVSKQDRNTTAQKVKKQKQLQLEAKKLAEEKCFQIWKFNF